MFGYKVILSLDLAQRNGFVLGNKVVLRHWNKASKQRSITSGVPAGQICYYCVRLWTVKPPFNGYDDAELKQALAIPSELNSWMSFLEKVYEIFRKRWKCAHLKDCELPVEIVVTKETTGSRTVEEGTEYRLDRFEVLFPEKAKDLKSHVRKNILNPVTNKIEVWCQLYDNEDGARRFQNYRDNGVELTRTADDCALQLDAQQQRQTFAQIASDLVGHQKVTPRMLTRALPSRECVISEKRKAKRQSSESSAEENLVAP